MNNNNYQGIVQYILQKISEIDIYITFFDDFKYNLLKITN